MTIVKFSSTQELWQNNSTFFDYLPFVLASFWKLELGFVCCVFVFVCVCVCVCVGFMCSFVWKWILFGDERNVCLSVCFFSIYKRHFLSFSVSLFLSVCVCVCVWERKGRWTKYSLTLHLFQWIFFPLT